MTRHEDPRPGAVAAGSPGALGADDLALGVELRRVLTEVPHGAALILRVVVARPLGETALRVEAVGDDDAGRAVDHDHTIRNAHDLPCRHSILDASVAPDAPGQEREPGVVHPRGEVVASRALGRACCGNAAGRGGGRDQGRCREEEGASRLTSVSTRSAATVEKPDERPMKARLSSDLHRGMLREVRLDPRIEKPAGPGGRWIERGERYAKLLDAGNRVLDATVPLRARSLPAWPRGSPGVPRSQGARSRSRTGATWPCRATACGSSRRSGTSSTTRCAAA